MKKLRINRIQYRNQGTTNLALRGQIEHHVTFKFDTEEEAITFKDNVKNWYYAEDETLDKESNEPQTKKTGRPKKDL